MGLAVGFAKARSLEQYGNAGYSLSLLVLTFVAWIVELVAGTLPRVGTALAASRDALKQVLQLSFPNADPVLRYLVSLPALIGFGLALVSVYAPWRIRFGRSFATAFLASARAVLGGADFFFRRRGAAAVVLVVLGVLLPLGFLWQRAADSERALSAEAYSRWLRHLEVYIDTTSLSQDEQDRAQRVLNDWARTKAEAAHPAAAELVATLQQLYGIDTGRSWSRRIASVARREPKVAADQKSEDGAVLAAHQVVLARARLRLALEGGCSSPDMIDATSRMFEQVKGRHEKSVAYGLVPLYRCGMDHHLASGQRPTSLKLCASAIDCASKALDRSAEDDGISSRECETVELKRRNNRLDVLLRLAVSYDKLAPISIPQATDKNVLGRELDAAEKSLIQCGQLYRLRDSAAFRTIAEAKAAAFDLSQLPSTDPLPASAKKLVEDSGRWLLTAKMLSPAGDPKWDFAPFHGILKRAEARQLFCGVLGETWSVAICT